MRAPGTARVPGALLRGRRVGSVVVVRRVRVDAQRQGALDPLGDVLLVVLQLEQAAGGAALVVDRVLGERGALGGAGGVRRDLGGSQYGLLIEEELAGVAGVPALVTGLRPL